jgi:hypothetical protein
MKKVIAIMLIILILFLFNACSFTSETETVQTIGPYVIIEHLGIDSTPSGHTCRFYLVYDINTKILYQFSSSGQGHNIIPYYEIQDNCIHMAKWENGNKILIPIS